MPFDDRVERVKAIVLVETIKATRGGHKLSFENILFLATHFEADYLPGSTTELVHIAEEIEARQEAKRRADEQF